MNARIVVAHAGRQYSHQLARALHERGALHEYWTGLPRDRHRGVGRVLDRVHPGAAYPEAELPADRVRVLPIGAAAHFAERHLRPSQQESLLGQLGDYTVDAVYAWRLSRAGPGISAIVGYENASLRTFRAARRLGIRTILDAASIHPAAADTWIGASAPSPWGRRVRERKEAELAYADHVLVLSALAKESYVAAGVPPDRIAILPLGFDPAVFAPAGDPAIGDPLRFVFVGNAGHRKGFDLLVEATRQLAASGARLDVTVIGDVSVTVPPNFELRGKLSQVAIAAAFARCDCLVLASRCDAFGMVVAEALGSGLPAIVSEHVGARDLVVSAGAGWVVAPGDANALAARMRACIERPQDVLEAKRRARAAAGLWTWERYRVRAVDTVLGLLAKDPPAHD